MRGPALLRTTWYRPQAMSKPLWTARLETPREPDLKLKYYSTYLSMLHRMMVQIPFCCCKHITVIIRPDIKGQKLIEWNLR